MNYPDSFNISFSYSYLFFIAGMVLVIAFTIFNYRITIPRISGFEKLVLVAVRSLALALILLAIFEPVLNLVYKDVEEPENLLFVDNSQSMVFRDSLEKAEKINEIISKFSEIPNTRTVLFGNKIAAEANANPDFSSGNTKLEDVSNYLKDQKHPVASVTILSDGIITEGKNPVYDLEKNNFPVNTIGIGDTLRKPDISIAAITKNRTIYKDKETSVVVSLEQSGYGNRKAVLEFYEDNVKLTQKNISLNANGLTKVKFNYTPASSGEKRLRFNVSRFESEENIENNSKSVFVNVLENKLRVMMLAGLPNSDYSFIKNILEKDENIELSEYIIMKNGKTIGTDNPLQKIDSADVLITISFPSPFTNDKFVSEINNLLNRNKTPIFSLLSNGIAYNKLKKLETALAVKVGGYNKGFNEIQPSVKDITNPILTAEGITLNDWLNLPPVFVSNSRVSEAAGSKIILESLLNGVPLGKPLAYTYNAGKKRNIVVNATDIWRWKLQSSNEGSRLLEVFINNSVKWLAVDRNKKQVNITTDKKFYSGNETVRFSGEVYDDLFEPVDDAAVEVKIGTETILLEAVGNGLYEGEYKSVYTGLQTYTASAKKTGNPLGTNTGKFSIGEVNAESLNLVRNSKLLKDIAALTNGSYFDIDNSNKLFKKINAQNSSGKRILYSTQKYNLWSESALLITIIVLLSVEWLLRKRAGML